jgi:hypothetical protein
MRTHADLHAFFAADADAHMRLHDHRHVVCAIADRYR